MIGARLLRIRSECLRSPFTSRPKNHSKISLMKKMHISLIIIPPPVFVSLCFDFLSFSLFCSSSFLFDFPPLLLSLYFLFFFSLFFLLHFFPISSFIHFFLLSSFLPSSFFFFYFFLPISFFL